MILPVFAVAIRRCRPFAWLLLLTYIAPVTAQTSPDVFVFALDRTLKVTARCDFQYKNRDGGDATTGEEKLFGTEPNDEAVATVVIISADGSVLGARHLIDELVEKYGEKGADGGVKRRCQREDVKLTFSHPIYGRQFEEAGSTSNREFDDDDAFTTKLQSNTGNPLPRMLPFVCYDQNLLYNRPEEGSPIWVFGYVDEVEVKDLRGREHLEDDTGHVEAVDDLRDKGSLGMGRARSRFGMSGGPVLDDKNRLIGILRGFQTLDKKRGIEENLFIPIKQFNQLLDEGEGWTGPGCGTAPGASKLPHKTQPSEPDWDPAQDIVRLKNASRNVVKVFEKPGNDELMIDEIEVGAFRPEPNWCLYSDADGSGADIAVTRAKVNGVEWYSYVHRGERVYVRASDVSPVVDSRTDRLITACAQPN